MLLPTPDLPTNKAFLWIDLFSLVFKSTFETNFSIYFSKFSLGIILSIISFFLFNRFFERSFSTISLIELFNSPILEFI